MEPIKKKGGVNPAGASPKSTHKANDAEKAPTRQHQKALARRIEKTPSYYIPSRVYGLIDVGGLRSLLLRHKQREWCSRVKLLGLMLLIEFFAKRRNSKGVSCSADLAHGYVSKLGRHKSPNTIPEPLAVLCEVQLLQVAQPAVNGWHVKHSALYVFHEDFASRPVRVFDIVLPPKLIQKRQQAPELYEKRDGLWDSLHPVNGDVPNQPDKYRVVSAVLRLSDFIIAHTATDDHLVVKLDVEGAEYDIVADLLEKPAALSRISELHLEWHKITTDRHEEEAQREQSLVDALQRAGCHVVAWPY